MNLNAGESVSTLETPATAQHAANLKSGLPEDKPLQLPDKPLITIEPGKTWVMLDLRSLWLYRELFYFLMWRDIKVRYKQTVLGVAWAIIQPLFTMLIFTFFFGRLANIGSQTGGIPYPLFAYTGILPWAFFSNALTNSGNSVIGSSHLITKVYFPRPIIPGAAVGAGLVDFGIAFLLMLGLMFYYGVALSWKILMLPPLVLLLTLLALGVGMLMSALNVKYRDVRYAMPFMIQIWMFASPIIYPVKLVPEKWAWVMYLNPLTGIIEGFRSSLLGTELDEVALAISVIITLSVLLYSAYAFRRMEKSFADII